MICDSQFSVEKYNSNHAIFYRLMCIPTLYLTDSSNKAGRQSAGQTHLGLDFMQLASPNLSAKVVALVVQGSEYPSLVSGGYS